MIDNYVAENVEKKKNKLSILMIAQYKRILLGPFVALFIYTKRKKNKKKFQPIKVPKNLLKNNK